MNAHADVVGIQNTDEATFRSFFLAELRRRFPKAACQTEWFRYDLLVQHARRNILIEFKYYLTRPLVGLDGSRVRWKGGAGPKNEGEFRTCVAKLRHCKHAPIHAKYLVLAYERNTPRKSGASFHASYRDLARGGGGDVVAVWKSEPRGKSHLYCVALEIK